MKGILKEFNDAGSKQKVKVEFIVQPSKSPDFNVLDLGAWASLSAGIPKVKCDRARGERMVDRIIFHVLERWKNWNSSVKLKSLFDTKVRIMKVVIDVKGSNEYKIPRSNNSHQGELPTYVPQEKRSERREIQRDQVEEIEIDCRDNERNAEAEEEGILVDLEELQLGSETGGVQSWGNTIVIRNEVLDYWHAREREYQ